MKINKKKLLKRLILILLLLGIAGTYLANRFVKSKGFNNIGEFTSNYFHNKSLKDGVTPLDLQIKVKQSDYDFLQKKRDESMKVGIQINVGDNYVPCKVILNGDTTEGEMRLKGHMTDHLEGEKWSFRVKTQRPVMGMYRFSLQHPGNRNYSYEWIYHQLLKQEDVIHLQYDFLNFTLNDKDLGIYAVEEHFGQHVPQFNNRPKGAILRWNPSLYWERRIDELGKVYLNEEYSAYSSSFAEPYDRGVVFDDEELNDTYLIGAQMLEDFRRGNKSTSEVFDVERMARFHAIIDLVGGHHSLDWSDVKFFYNSETQKIEPVGYESFSVGKSEYIAGQRPQKSYEGDEFDYHARLFSDPEFFAVYIQEIERICDEAYFNNFIESIQAELDQKNGVLAYEFPYIKYSFEGYFENIELIRHNLELPKPFHAFLEEKNDSIVRLSLAPVSDYPIEVISLVSKGKKEFKPNEKFILPAKARETYAHYFPLTISHDGSKMKNLTLKAKIPGSSHVFEVEVAKYASYGGEVKIPEDSLSKEDKETALFEYVNDSTILMKGQEVVVDELVTVGKGQTLRLLAGQKVHFENGGGVVVEGALRMYAYEENEIIISSDQGALGFMLKDGSLDAAYIQIHEANSTIFSAVNSTMRINSSVFSNCHTAIIEAEHSFLTLNNLASGSMNSLGDFYNCQLEIEHFVANKGEEFLTSKGSEIKIISSSFAAFEQVIDLDRISYCRIWNSSFEENNLIAALNGASNFQTYGCSISSGDLGFKVDLEKELAGSSAYNLYKTDASSLKQLEQRENS